MNASFEVGPVSIPISTESAINIISLSIVDGEELSISGFPRALLTKKVMKGKSRLSSNLQVPSVNLILVQNYLHLPTNMGNKSSQGVLYGMKHL